MPKDPTMGGTSTTDDASDPIEVPMDDPPSSLFSHQKQTDTIANPVTSTDSSASSPAAVAPHASRYPSPLPANSTSLTLNPPYHNPHMHNNVPQPESASSSLGKSTFLLTTGAVLGLTAAAAVRWLNGDDFSLFPKHPPSTQATHSIELEQDLERHNSVERNESAAATSDVLLHQDIRSLTEAIRDQSHQQNNMVQQLLRREDSQRVSQSMDLLRQQQHREQEHDVTLGNHSNNHSDSRMVTLSRMLGGLHEQMSHLKDDLNQTETVVDAKHMETRLDAMMQTLQSCMDTVAVSCANEESSSPMQTLQQEDPLIPMPSSPLATNINSDNKLNRFPTKDSNNTTISPINDGGNGETTVPHGSGRPALAAALQRLTHNNTADQLKNGLPLLCLYTHNLAKHPHMPRYRTIYTSNESFQTRIQTLTGGVDVLAAVGFEEAPDNTCWEWLPNAADTATMTTDEVEREHLEYLQEAATALQLLQQQLPQQQPSSSSTSARELTFSPSTYSPLRSSSSNANALVQPTSSATSSDALLCPQTPDPSIKSPPVPKKQIFFRNPSDDGNDDDKLEKVQEDSSAKTGEHKQQRNKNNPSTTCPELSPQLESLASACSPPLTPNSPSCKKNEKEKEHNEVSRVKGGQEEEDRAKEEEPLLVEGSTNALWK